MNKTKIEWCDYSWNPIRGLCPMNCKTPDGKEYCYARRLYKRFKRSPELSFIFDDPTWSEIEKLQHINPPAGSKIFVCSTIEMFHPEIKKEWRDDIFKVIECNKKYIWIILTKLPQNIDRPMPENAWLGVSITRRHETWKLQHLFNHEIRIRFVSFEPLFDDIAIDILGHWEIAYFKRLNWIIIGRLTGHGRKYDLPKGAVERIVRAAKMWDIPVFIKDNLGVLMGENYVKEHQQWPK